MKRILIVITALSCTFLGVSATSVLAAIECEAVTYSPFDPDDSRLSINGDASVDLNDGSLDLTPPLNGQSGSVFTTEGVALGPDAGFSTKFSFQFTEAGNGGADGMVFTLQTVSSSVGGGGGGIGYEGLSPSVGVEFDSWFNGGSDPDDNHVGINVNGSMVSDPTADAPAQLDGGEVFYAWVDYDGATNVLEVRLTTTDDRPTDPTITTTIDLAAILLQNPDDEVFVGFTSGTGGAHARHTVLTWEFVNCLANIGAPPTAADDAVETDEDTDLAVAAPGVLANDIGVGLSVAAVNADAVTGTLDVADDGSLVYSPPAAAQALDDSDALEETFTYEAANVDGVDEATVTITVHGVNDAPTADAGADKVTLDVDEPVALAGMASDIDDGETPTVLWTVEGPCTLTNADTLTPELTCSEAGTWTVTITADDGDATGTDSLEVEVLATETLPETGVSSLAIAVLALLMLAAGRTMVRRGRSVTR